ncbi:MAG: NADH-quinone oxidoreductase subunit A [Steroidobacteraceae bacterium]
MPHALQLSMLALYFGAILVLLVLMLVLSAVLGERHAAPATLQPFESGMIPVGTARLRFPSQFYLIAMFFVIFDLEAVFIYAWAVAARAAGWAGYIEVVVFIAVLATALLYLWRSGALDWTPLRSRTSQRRSTPRRAAQRPGG